jgi:hypothetical protein
MYPRERISEDFDALADRILGTTVSTPSESSSPKASGPRFGLGFLGRRKAAARA